MTDCFFFPDDPACAPEPTTPDNKDDGKMMDGDKEMHDDDMMMELSPW